VNVKKSEIKTDGVDWRQLFKAVLVYAFLSWIGQSFSSSLSSELQGQVSQAGFIAGIVATISYNLAMYLYLLNKPILTEEPGKIRRVTIGVFMINIIMVAMIVFIQMSWPSNGKNVSEVALTFIQPERMTPGLITVFQMVAFTFFTAATYYVMSLMVGIQNLLAPSPRWPAK
jgi:hypothetical protein